MPSSPAYLVPPRPNLYPAWVVRVIDGDTIAMPVDIWPGLTQQATIRVFRIDTLELRADQQCEKMLAGKAMQFTKDFLADSQIWIGPPLTASDACWRTFRRAGGI